MNIKERALRSVALVAAAISLTWGTASAFVPDALTDLTAMPGTNTGSVRLTWTAQGDGSGSVTTPASRYEIRYRQNQTISNEPEWQGAIRITQPPVNQNQPNPASPLTPQFIEINGLSAGVTYGFAMRAYNVDASNFSTEGGLSNTVTATAKEPCGLNANDGLSVSSVACSRSIIKAGQPTDFDFSIAIGGAGLVAGGKVILRVPDAWPRPSTTTAANGGGFVQLNSVLPSGMTMSFENQNIVFTASNPLGGGSINVKYFGFTCEAGPVRRFEILSQYTECGTPLSVNRDVPITTQAGPAEFVDFVNYDLTVPVGVITRVDLRLTDNCRNVVVSTLGAVNVNVQTLRFSSGTAVTDTSAEVALLGSMSGAGPTVNVVLPAFSTGTSFFYRINSTNFRPDNRLRLQHQNVRFPANTMFWTANVYPVASGITNSSADTGSTVANQKTVSFSPDGDGVADTAFINFTVPERLSWKVEISSDNFVTIIRRFFGDSVNARVSWDGFIEGSANVPPSIAPPGTYRARIAFGPSAEDTSLTLNLVVAGISGAVRTAGTLTPLADVDLEIYGASNRYSRTLANGSFLVYGLRPGVYSFRCRKSGFSTQEININVTAGTTLNLGTIDMVKQSVLRIQASRAAAEDLPEIWGSVRVNNANWTKQDQGTIHFGRGRTESDAGDLFNAVPTSFTALTLAATVLYRVHFEVPNLKIADFNVSLAQDEVRFSTVALVRSANIEGNVSVPTPPQNGLWISVEAGPDSNMDGIYDNQDPSKRYYGGLWLSQNETSGLYRIFGVANGTYTVTGYAQGYVPQRTIAIVLNDVDDTAHLSTFTVGGQVFGSITVQGDSTGLDARDGTIDSRFSVPVNVFSQAQQNGSYVQVSIPTDPTSTTSTFTVTGLADGTYDVFANLSGFEVTPAGRKTVTVVSSSGSINLTFGPFTGTLVGDITLPNGNSDFNNVALSLQPFDFNLERVDVNASSASYTLNNLGTGYYSLRATYATTGFTVEKNVQIVNGRTVRVDLDVSGPTYTITGQVSTAARSPYNDLGYLVLSSTPSELYPVTGGGGGGGATLLPVTIGANRISVERLVRNQDFRTSAAFNPASYDASKIFFVLFDSSGAFSIPMLTPGAYRLRTNGEIDGDFSNGSEISDASTVIRIATGDVSGVVLAINDGYDINGSLRLTSDDIPTQRNAILQLKNAAGTIVAEQRVTLTGSSVSFVIYRVPDGDYVLSTQDEDFTKAFSAKDVRVKVSGRSPDTVTIDLVKPAQIRGKLRIKTSGTLLSTRNFDQFLSTNFSIEARANPWFSGGFGRATTPLIDSDGYFVIATNPGKYDVLFRSFEPLSALEVSQGKKQFVPGQATGIEVTAGQVTDLGIVDLVEGATLTGTVRNGTGDLLANVQVIAYPSRDQRNGEPLMATTNELGQYSLQGIDTETARLYDVVASPRSRGDDRLANLDGPRYAEVRRTQIDTRTTTSVDFVLSVALGSVKGVIATPDNGALQLPFDGDTAEPGAEIIMNKAGDIPLDNPLGNIQMTSRTDGSFEMKGLVPGSYSLWALASGYGSGFRRDIVVGNTVVDIGTVTLQAGQKLFGAITTASGGSPDKTQLDTIIAVRNGFEELLIGSLTEDAAGNITDYAISGFLQDKPYTILTFNKSNDILILAENVVVNELTRRDFTLAGKTPSVLTQYSRNTNGTIIVQFDFTRALRNSAIDLNNDGVPDDADAEEIITKISGGGPLAFDTNWLSADRKRASVTYTPASGEKRFSLRIDAVFSEINDQTGQNYEAAADFTYFLGIGKQKEQKFTNASGGSVQLEEDVSEFSAQPGTFGASADDEVNVLFRVAISTGDLNEASAMPGRSRVMANASALGLNAYPSEMGAAINRARTMAVDPFSSFYDIFLPAGVSHFFPEGREAQLCLAYDSSVTDPYSLNVYYFNTTSNEFILESQNKAVDTDNSRICVTLSHASVFTVLQSSLTVISGSGYTGALNVINFPNPFNLKPKTVTLQNPGSASATQTVEGTMIKVSVPAGMAGDAKIDIYSITGERVREIHTALTSGTHNYVEWNGRNDAGTQVASGTYIGRLYIGGEEKFFKMAVLK